MEPVEKALLSNSDEASFINDKFEFLQKPVKMKLEEIKSHYACYVCRKTFNNANALQNHKNMQHDPGDSENDDGAPTIIKVEQVQGRRQPMAKGAKLDIISCYGGWEKCMNWILDAPSDFKFFPLKNSNEDNMKVGREYEVTKQTFTEDTSYLIVKYDGSERATAKRSRLDSTIKKMQLKPEKKLVDFRGPFTCTLPSNLGAQCHQIFFNCCEYSLHYRDEHTKRRKAALRCQICEKRLDRNIYLTNTLTSPLESLNFYCNSCGLSFFDSAQYDEHKRLVHAKIKPHQCSICCKRFTQIGGLQQHMRMHSGIRPFVCRFCDKAFTQKAGLDQHLRTHTKVKPFKCIICCKCFSQSVHLRQHMRTHTNIQPFGCPMCHKRFKQSSHLNFHMRCHVNETRTMEQCAPAAQQQAQSMNFLNLTNVQPVVDGDTVYYAAQLTSEPESTGSTPYFFQVLSNNVS